MKAPDKNKNGLVLPPTPVKLTPEAADRKGIKSIPDGHHIYFPRISFLEAGSVAYRFREHKFNRISLPRFQHERLHRRYDPLVREYPDYFIPKEDVMVAFLDEAELLEGLGVNIRAIDMMDDAIYEGRVKKLNHTLENRAARMQNIGEYMRRICGITVIPKHIIQPYIEMGRLCLGPNTL